MGKMNRGTYQLNAYTSDWGGGRSGVAERGRLCLWSLGKEGVPPTPLQTPLNDPSPADQQRQAARPR